MFESSIILILISTGVIGLLAIIRRSWRKYLLLYFLSSLSANLLCYAFTAAGLYSFPHIPFHESLIMPVGIVSTVFPLVVLAGVRYSPLKWIWKIPFYWGIVHLGVLGEVMLKHTSIFKFSPEWDLWDSYTLWWIYLLLFELLSGKLIPVEQRRPLSEQLFKYGNWGWIFFHVIVISTIFLAGLYTGVTYFR